MGKIRSSAIILCVTLGSVCAADPGGVLKEHTLASFSGSGQNSIQAIASDSSGNIYVAGTTSSADLPVLNAIQPKFGDSRIMRTTDLGVTWTPVGSPPAEVDVVVQDPIATQVLFAAGDTGIYKTVDGGATWRLVRVFTPTFSQSHSLALDPGNHARLAAITSEGQFIRSLDAGETWTTPAPCPPSGCAGARFFADLTGSGSLLFFDSHLSISRDWGLSFQPITPPASGFNTAAFDPSHPGWIYLSTGTGPMAGLFLSTDYGATWTSKAVPHVTFAAFESLAVDPDQPNTLVGGTADALYKSSDGAASWTQTAGSFGNGGSPLVIPRRNCAAQGGLFAIYNRQVIFSPDYGATWQSPKLSLVSGLNAGAGCAVYVTRQPTTDAFVAKLAPDGTKLWTTFLGGSDQDSAAALVLDSQGNAYIAGSTISPDFPTTVPRIGVSGQADAFVTKLSADGRLVYSAILGGEASDAASALAVDLGQNVYVVGRTSSAGFPVTPGALVTKPNPQSSIGFIAKLTPNAALVYASYLGTDYNFPAAILVNPNGEATIAGVGAVPGFSPPGSEYIMKLDQAGSRVTAALYLPVALGGGGAGPTSLATDADGNLFVAGVTDSPDFHATPGAFSGGQRAFGCPLEPSSIPGDIYVTKLRGSDWQTIYTALLSSQCGSRSGNILVDNSGAVILPVSSGPGFPLHNPLLAGPSCPDVYHSSAVAKLSPDGSTLQFATYLNDCWVPAAALAQDGSLYAGVTGGDVQGSAGILHLTTEEKPPISLDQIANAFSGDARALVPGSLFSLGGQGIDPDFNDLGLDPAQDLPTQLTGVQVTFDGIPAPVFQTAPGRVIVVPPLDLGAFTSVQVSYKGVLSNVVWMPVSKALPGLLTRDFPNLPPPRYPDFPDGNIRNQDGTLNDATHPAAVGSTITLFVTGMGVTNPRVAPGSIAHSLNIIPVTPVYSSWNGSTTPDPIFSLQGFVSAFFQIPVKVRDPILPPGTPAGEVQRVPIGLLLTEQINHFVPPVSNQVGVYVK